MKKAIIVLCLGLIACTLFADWQQLGILDEEVWASSALTETSRGKTITYGPEALLDGDPGTPWAEESPGSGIGEWVMFRTRRPVESLSIVNGFARSASLYDKNNRLKQVAVSFLAGFTGPGMITELDYRYYAIQEFAAQAPIALKDSSVAQTVPFPFTFEEQQAMFLSALKACASDPGHSLSGHLANMGMSLEDCTSQENAGLIMEQYGFIGFKVTITEVYKGSAYDDTCVSELTVTQHGDLGLWEKPASSAVPFKPGMVSISGGVFAMGSDTGEKDEQPIHQVTVGSFSLGKYEVTYAEFDAYCDEMKRDKPTDEGGRGRRPVRFVQWYDALNYCNWLSWKEGLTPVYSSRGSVISCDFSANGYRLPTEAEWEYAARGGGRGGGHAYAGGDSPIPIGWFEINSGSSPQPVGGKLQNELGLHDMSGNLMEWCWDLYGSYRGSAQSDPRGAESGNSRVVRGGSYLSYATDLRVSARAYGAPGDNERLVGFRLARSSR
jgi:formylglycine-generating enzyme required for sulfatase activity